MVLNQELSGKIDAIRAKKPQRIPTGLTKDEVSAIMANLTGTPHLIVSLLYGSGLRILECVRLRVKDIDAARHELTVRDGKGAKDRRTMLPQSVIEPLQAHLRTVKHLHEENLKKGYGTLPYALAQKYPNASREWRWQYVFDVKKCMSLKRLRNAKRGSGWRNVTVADQTRHVR